MYIGNEAVSTKRITLDDVEQFARISGDFNPIHIDEEYAKTTRFKKRIVHGMLVASQISALIANQLPGKGSIYLSQSLNFVAPVFIDDEISTCVKITEIKGKVYTLSCECRNSTGNLVITGTAKILKDV